MRPLRRGALALHAPNPRARRAHTRFLTHPTSPHHGFPHDAPSAAPTPRLSPPSTHPTIPITTN